MRGLAAMKIGTSITVVAVSTDNKVVVFVDDGSGSPAGTTIATAGTNTAYRGVAFSPTP